MTMDNLDFSGVDSVLRGSSSEAARGLDLMDIARRAVTGQLDLSPGGLLDGLLTILFGETRALFGLTRDMIIVAALSALFKAAGPGFKGGAAAETGFYVNYMIVVAMLLSTLKMCFDVMRGMVTDVCGFVAAAQPLMVSLVVMGGGAARGAMFSPVALYAAAFFTNVVSVVVVPALGFAAVVRMVNYLSEKDTLLKCTDGIQALVSKGLKLAAGVFLAVLAAQKFAAPAVDGLLSRSAKGLAGMVPVVGSSLTTAVDAALYFASVARGGVLTALLAGVAAVCVAPMIQIAAYALVYKGTAALIQPLCDERIVEAIDGAGKLAGLALGVAGTVAGLAVLMTVIVLSFGY